MKLINVLGFSFLFTQIFILSCSSTPQSNSKEANAESKKLTNQDAFDAAIKTKQKNLEDCYKKWGNRQLNIQISFDFTIRYNGDLFNLEVNESRTHGVSSAFKDCMITELKTIHYPEVIGYDRANYNYTFSY